MSQINHCYYFLADHTATQCDQILAQLCRLSICLSVTLCIVGQRTVLKVLSACS